jgi:phosphoribosylformimino-5-aminoimidazole carboxamide ribotide isomerase
VNFTIYPAIDLRAGKVVRLKEGDPGRLTAYSDDPAFIARRWLEAGAGWLHVVNLDAAFSETDQANRRALEAILRAARDFHAQVQFGGGLRSPRAIETAIEAGVSRVVLGTIALEQPGMVVDSLKTLGVEKVAVGIDARNGWVRVRGWKDQTGVSAVDLAVQMRRIGLQLAIFTDVSRDGVGSGLNIDATRELAEASGLQVIASGGVQTLDDVGAARSANLAGVIIGRALYENTIDLKEALNANVS